MNLVSYYYFSFFLWELKYFWFEMKKKKKESFKLNRFNNFV